MAAARMWGRADDFDIVFEQMRDGDWQATVPADLSDGQYAVEIWAANAIGEQAYWTGILYMVDCRLVCLHLIPDKYQVVMLPERYCATLVRRCCCV